MQFENRDGGYILLEAGDHSPLKLPQVVRFIPIDSPVLDKIEVELECNIDDTAARLMTFRRERSGMMFQVHGDLLAMQGVRDQIRHFREVAEQEQRRQLWGSVDEEPPISFESGPDPEPAPCFTLVRNNDFDPFPPSIA